jgi:hypothetical protein
MNGPPPLEDCSLLLKQRKTKTTAPSISPTILKQETPEFKTPTNSSLMHLENQPTPKPSGLKAGFFNSPTKKRDIDPKSNKNIEKITPKSSPLVIESVQEALKGAVGSEGWTSPDFLEKIDKNPILGISRLFNNRQLKRSWIQNLP